MRIIERDIVGAFIFSSDNKVLLGNNKKGGTYENQLVVPGGGIENGETELEAIKREVLEEIGIDISDAQISQIDKISTGESKKTIHETGEEVLMKMRFYDFKVSLADESKNIKLKFEDDFEKADWYTAKELNKKAIGQATEKTLRKVGFI